MMHRLYTYICIHAIVTDKRFGCRRNVDAVHRSKIIVEKMYIFVAAGSIAVIVMLKPQIRRFWMVIGTIVITLEIVRGGGWLLLERERHI